MSITHSATQPTHRSGLRSTNVFLDNAYEPIEAIILVEHGKIHDIITVSEASPDHIKEIETNWKIENYGNLCIFPGLIDSNVHLHAGYDKDWDNVSSSTKLAAAGGITTVVDNPVMMKDFETFEEYLEVIKERIEILKHKSKVDFGVFGVLESRTQENIDEVLQLGVLGLKGYLFNCLQNTVGFTDPEQLGAIMDYLDENYPGLLLAFHPEMATEREMYSSSPCRLTKKEDRLDMDFEIKSLEFGGGANRGAYLEELSMTPGSADMEDDDCPTPSLDTPSKLRSKIKKAKEKTEINQLAHYELMSYGYEENKNDPDNYSSDSDSDAISDVSFNSPGVKVNRTPSSGKKEKQKTTLPEPVKFNLSKFAKSAFSNKEEITEVASEENESSPQKQSIHNPRLTIRKSIFAARVNSDLSNQDDNTYDRPLFDQNNETPEPSSGSPFKNSDIDNSSNGNSATTVLNENALIERNIKLNGGFIRNKPRASTLMIDSQSKVSRLLDTEAQEDKLAQLNDNVDTCLTKNSLHTADKENEDSTKFSSYPKTLLSSGTTNEYRTESSASDLLDSTKKLVLTSGNSFMDQDRGDKSLSAEKQPAFAFTPELQYNEQDKENTPTVGSPLSGELSNLSSLMLRRMSRKSHSMNLSTPVVPRNNLTMPARSLKMMNSLELTTKSPNHKSNNEDKFNKSYRIFLANRPQSWEENAVTLILSKLKPETKLKVMMQNMSLASSFLKLRQKKKADDKFMDMVYGDTSVAYLFFNERSVKPSETKYKASPPIRDKENRKLLIENFRLGGVDMVTSYHFYVPPQYKDIDGGNFRRAFAGYNSIGFNLQSLWTTMYIFYKKNNKKFKQEHLFQKKMIGDLLCKMTKVLSSNPAHLLRIDDRKGSIAKGKDADFVVWDPYKKINNQDLCSTHIFSKRMLFGLVHKTYLRGQVIYDKDNIETADDLTGSKAEFVRANNISVKC